MMDTFTFNTDEGYITFSKREDKGIVDIRFIGRHGEDLTEDWCFKSELSELIDNLIKFIDED